MVKINDSSIPSAKSRGQAGNLAAKIGPKFDNVGTIGAKIEPTLSKVGIIGGGFGPKFGKVGIIGAPIGPSGHYRGLDTLSHSKN